MTDTTSMIPGASAEDVRTRNRKAIFDALAEAGIHRVTVEYDGSGDSGQIESVEAWNAANEKVPLPSSRKVQFAFGNPDRPIDEISLEAAIEELAWDYLWNEHCGWENNDGAFGTFAFDVTARTITLEHNERFTDTNTYSHQF